MSSEWYVTNQKTMQGAATHGDRVWVTSSKGGSKRGWWYWGKLPKGANGKQLVLSTKHRKNTPAPGPEDVSYDASGGHYWTLSEYPRNRYVFPSNAGCDRNGWPDC